MYWRISARSKKAVSMESERLDVVITSALRLCFSLSSSVSSALTTRIESLGSAPVATELRAFDRLSISSISTTTKPVSSSTS